jgi:ABC-type Fe3+/spermidine/putrescine transport system ATPase subunit
MTATVIERASPSTPALAVRALSSHPARGRGIADVSLQVAQRRVTVLLGPPGSGRSALLRAIAGLDRPQNGSIEVAGREVSTQALHRRGVGLVLQQLALFPRLSAADNIRYGMRVARWRSTERELRLAERGHSSIDELSAFEQLSVAIARAIAVGPRVLLLDEPLAGFAPPERAVRRPVLRQLLDRLQLGVLLATSDVDDAMALGADLAVINEGRLLQQGPVGDVAAHPASAEVARLLGYVVILDGRVGGDRVNELSVGAVPIPPGGPRDGRVQVLAHPAALLAVPAGRGLGIGVSGEVVASQPLGPLWQVQVALGGREPLLARWEWDDQSPSPGTAVDLVAPATGLHFFSRLSATVGAARPSHVHLDPPVRETRRLAEIA